MNNSRILIFSASFGAGHIKAAEAVVEAIHAKDPSIDITHIDFGAFFNKAFNTVLKKTYITIIKHTPKLYGKFYYRAAKIPPNSILQRFVNGLGRHELIEYIHSVQPDLIICTYSTVTGIMGRLRQTKAIDIPVVSIITDFAVHPQWVHSGVDLYIAACGDVYDGLVQRGIDPGRIHVTGIPVHPKFEQGLSRREMKEKLGLFSDRPTYLIMGGAHGVLGKAKWICKLIADAEEPVQGIVVCGKDERLYKSLDGIIAEARNPMLRFGFVNNVEELMSAADLIITKAGGLVISEALTKHLPMFVYKPIPGQEEENADYVEKIGAGVVARNVEEMEDKLHDLLRYPGRLEKMGQAAASALPGKAAERTAGYIFGLLERKKLVADIG